MVSIYYRYFKILNTYRHYVLSTYTTTSRTPKYWQTLVNRPSEVSLKFLKRYRSWRDGKMRKEVPTGRYAKPKWKVARDFCRYNWKWPVAVYGTTFNVISPVQQKTRLQFAKVERRLCRRQDCYSCLTRLQHETGRCYALAVFEWTQNTVGRWWKKISLEPICRTPAKLTVAKGRALLFERRVSYTLESIKMFARQLRVFATFEIFSSFWREN